MHQARPLKVHPSPGAPTPRLLSTFAFLAGTKPAFAELEVQDGRPYEMDSRVEHDVTLRRVELLLDVQQLAAIADGVTPSTVAHL